MRSPLLGTFRIQIVSLLACLMPGAVACSSKDDSSASGAAGSAGAAGAPGGADGTAGTSGDAGTGGVAGTSGTAGSGGVAGSGGCPAGSSVVVEATEEAPADCAPVAWFDQFGGPADQAVRGTTFDTQGNIWITGKTTEALDGPHDGDLAADFARKYSPQGEVVWTKQGTGGSIGWHVRLDSDGNLYNTVTTRTADIPSEAEIIGGGGFGDCALRKYSPAGELLWERYLGGAKDDICYLELSNGRPIVFGSSEGDIYNQNGVRAEAVLTTFDEEGNPLWHTVYDTNDDDYFFDLATTPQGNMLVLAGVSYGCCNGIGRTHQIELTPNGEVVDDRILFSAYE
ncbi:MAG: hypothetical protein KC492_41470, partial [Myxococcales bacterium]|nr:hypothetical protein [Myxococcales bacterium]